MNTLSIERAKQVQSISFSAAICNAHYINSAKDSQQYKSLKGQRLSLIEFHEFMFNLSDIELQNALKKHKNYVTNNYESMMNDRFLDLTMTRAAIDYQLVLREGMKCEIDLLEEIARDWRSDLKLAEDFAEINSECLLRFMKNLNDD